MRIRNIKPDFFKHDVLAELPALARLLFIGLWCMADCEGRLEDRPKRIKAEVVPYDECDVEALLESLTSAGFLVRYEAEGQRLIEIPGFARHQRLGGKEAAATSRLPSAVPLQPGSDREAPGKQSGMQGGEGKEGEGKGEAALALDSSRDTAGDPTLDEFLTETRKVGIPDPFARDKYLAKLETGFGRRWKPYVQRVAVWHRENSSRRNGHAAAPVAAKRENRFEDPTEVLVKETLAVTQ